MSSKSTRIARIGSGCGMLFALPFVAVGVGMTWWTWRSISQYEAMQSWVEVPAIITQTELERKQSDDGVTFRVTAEYQYEYEGREFTGQRVSIHSGSDNIGSFQRDAYQELKRHLAQKKPFRCFVNPEQPSEAVLYRRLRWEMTAFFTVFATTFGGAGLGILTGALVYALRTPKSGGANVPADEPWMARADWASGRIQPSGGTAFAVPILGILTVWWAVASFPLMSKLPEILQAADSRWAMVTLVFPAVGAVLVLILIYQFIRSQKFGRSTLELATTPGVVGGKMAGVIRIPKSIQTAEGFRLKLSCIEHSLDSNGESREDVVWQTERLVTEPMHDRMAGGTAVPVLFAIPYEAEGTSPSKIGRHVEWRLEASAEMPGVDYKTQFEVPVFKSAESRADFQLDERLVAEFTAAPRRDLLLRQAKILKEPLPGAGVRLVFPAARNLEVALPLTALTALWSGAVWLMLHLEFPVVFPIIFGLIDLLLIWLVINLWLHRSVVEARSDGLTFRGGWFGIGRKHRIAAEDVKRITTSSSMSVGTKVWNNIVVVPRTGKQRTIAQSIEGQLAQQAIVDEINQALRRDADTGAERA